MHAGTQAGTQARKHARTHARTYTQLGKVRFRSADCHRSLFISIGCIKTRRTCGCAPAHIWTRTRCTSRPSPPGGQTPGGSWTACCSETEGARTSGTGRAPSTSCSLKDGGRTASHTLVSAPHEAPGDLRRKSTVGGSTCAKSANVNTRA